MGIKKFIEDIDPLLGERWFQDSENQEYTKEDTHVAMVLTRQDTALNASINGYNGRTLESIRNGIWLLVVLSIVHLIKYFI